MRWKSKGYKEFFDKHISIIKSENHICKECKGKLIGTYSEVCHILPKSYFKSIAKEDSNIIYLCQECHTNYDNWSNDKIKEMNIFEEISNSFEQLRDKIEEKINYKHNDRWAH